MSLRRTALIAAATIFSLALAVYVALYGLWERMRGTAPLAYADQCTDESSTTLKENPNKMLFVSCGGFLE